jgi:hypothetical protein
MPFDKVCLFLWTFICPFVTDENKLDAMEGRKSLDLKELHDSLNNIIPHTFFSLSMMSSLVSNDMLEAFARNLIVYGYPRKYMETDNNIRAVQDRFFSAQGIKSKNMKGTLYSNWYIYAKHFLKVLKTTEDDAVDFFKTIDSIFYLFEKLNIICVPWELRYPVSDNISGVKRSSE